MKKADWRHSVVIYVLADIFLFWSRFETESTLGLWLLTSVSSKGHSCISISLLKLIFLSIAGQEDMSW